ncbi:hypothetical protein COU60_00975 [Candidatus Pacearchaeota archaeon CG10_big_fil_rev_8_21_14_0_10_34_76]|nr:MAG: hypothetical protein COU60_00975 [Candidatus Pacearchaeota archaeon CG10_big_fil_rev_8_21_14_0_10_34_76]
MTETTKKGWYDKHYKKLLFIPAILLVFSLIFLFQFNAKNGDLILTDVSITGGTTISVFDAKTDINDLKQGLSLEFPDSVIRGISNIRTGEQQGFFVETKATPEEIRPFLESYLGYELTTENSSTEFTGNALSSSFYQQLRLAVIIAFILMAIVVFVIFRTFVPSFAVILSAFMDIVFTIVLLDLLNFNLSIGGIVALLMLIGYSVDTDIMLTSRILRKKDVSLNKRMAGALKTGLTMTLTSIVAIAISLAIIFNFSETLRQMFTILLIGLGFDILNTWVANASILKWYAEAKNLG